MDPLGTPSPTALRAFGLGGTPRRLPGGQGCSWVLGEGHERVVLKRVAPGLEAEEAAWCADLLSALAGERGFRIAVPVPSTTGTWIAEGWTVSRWVEGEPGPEGRWPALLAAARAFHAALAGMPRPAFLARRTHRWARADRAAWDEEARPTHPGVAPLAARLRALVRPPAEPPQLVHADLSGNVLFAPGLPPAVIDLSPYWRPAVYAEAIAVADGLLWHGEGAALLDVAGRAGDLPLVARGALFRLLDLDEQLLPGGIDAHAALAPYARVAALLEARAGVHASRRPSR
ncbi:TIGR02569 family protein [Amnibacterium sp. CER49]|uniref:TIGR02569 family protein n=1 Tax=Amnibacterium sp. CER49 TaxID=3039161 RepID=UPI00244D6ABB|nr:TIGR02569 family protein [Amnibacterium sp. CER49]MDH2445426.1 TIGR02569 family protein [Amnibacterium sp. CER49]